MTKVFVYGSLKRGGENHFLMEDIGAIPLGHARTMDAVFNLLRMTDYPAVVAGSKRIAGEIYEISRLGLLRIDQLEGEGIMYDRKEILDMAGVSCWIYMLNRSLLGLAYRDPSRIVRLQDGALSWAV